MIRVTLFCTLRESENTRTCENCTRNACNACNSCMSVCFLTRATCKNVRQNLIPRATAYFAWLKQCWDAPRLDVRSCLLAKGLYRLRQQFGAAAAGALGSGWRERRKPCKGNGRLSNTHGGAPSLLGLNTAFESKRSFSQFTQRNCVCVCVFFLPQTQRRNRHPISNDYLIKICHL